MRCSLGLVVVLGLLLVGCESRPVPIAAPPPAKPMPSAASTSTDDSTDTAATGDSAAAGAAATAPSGASETAPGGEGAATATPAPEAITAATPVALSGGAATLTPENTKIQFVGTHSPPKPPEPRVGGFSKFEGKATVDAATKTLQTVTVDIDTTSLFTPIEKLTTHLKSPDFFDVNEHPTARFESAKIVAEEGGKATITGSLTLHGMTKEITFPATIAINDEGLTLKSEFSIDRTEFGMTFGKGAVENTVSMTVVIGEKTAP